MASNQEEYLRINGVLMKPGVRVCCRDSSNIFYGLEGTIIAATRQGTKWSFDISFDGPTGQLSNPPQRMFWYLIAPTPEEANSESARRYRAENSLNLFLCHATEDKQVVRALHGRLKEMGFQPWLDEIDLLPGVPWESAIETAVHDSHVILICISHTSTTKAGFVQKEIHFALERALEMPENTIYIIPVRLNDCALPKRLSKWQAVDLFKENGEEQLIKALRKRAEDIALHSSA